MNKIIFWIVLGLSIVGYIWQDKIGDFFFNRLTAKYRTEPTRVECEVRDRSCASLARTLGKLNTAQYYDTAGKLLGVSLEDTTIYKEGNYVIFQLPNRTKLVHNRALTGPDKGSLTVVFPQGEWMKYDAKGNLLLHGRHGQ